MIYLLITKLLRECRNQVCDFTYFCNGCLPTSANLHEAPAALHQNIFMPVCALSATENLAAVSIGRIIISAFSIIRMPSIIFYVIL